MEDRVCILCPVKGGALKPVQQEGVDQNAKQQDWAHIMCCIWCEETYFADADAMEPIAGVKKVFAKKHANACFICQGDTGAILTCSSPKCKKAFHPTCGTQNNCTLNLRLSKDGTLDWNVACDVHSPKGAGYCKTIHNMKVDTKNI